MACDPFGLLPRGPGVQGVLADSSAEKQPCRIWFFSPERSEDRPHRKAAAPAQEDDPEIVLRRGGWRSCRKMTSLPARP